MALYDNTLPPTAYFRPPVYRQGGNILMDKYGKSTLFGDITATALPILGTAAGALIGGPAGAAIGNQLGQLGTQGLSALAGDRNDDSAESARASAANMNALGMISGKVADMAMPFLGGAGKADPTSAVAKAVTGSATAGAAPSLIPPIPDSKPFSVNTPTFPSLLPNLPGDAVKTSPLANIPLWQQEQTLFGGQKPRDTSFF